MAKEIRNRNFSVYGIFAKTEIERLQQAIIQKGKRWSVRLDSEKSNI
jgi:hypothetical protein